MTFYRLTSALLGYPDAALRADLPEIALLIAHDETLNPSERNAFSACVEYLALADATTLEADYVRFIDMTPELSLHLTHHILGSDKNRGPALIDLALFYEAHGLTLAVNELPDYLPLMLEFAATQKAAEGARFLARWRRVLIQLQTNLTALDAAYARHLAALIGLIIARAGEADVDLEDELASLSAQAAIQQAMRSPFRAEDFADEDERGVEAPVDWAAPPALTQPVRFHPRAGRSAI